MPPKLYLLWVDLTRFDQKPDKSTWLEMARELSRNGIETTIVTSFGDRPYTPADRRLRFLNIEPSRLPLLFRLSVMWRAFREIRKRRNLNPVVILPPNALYLTPLLRWSGMSRIHLDVRTVPVTVRGLKRWLDVALSWRMTMRLFGRYATSASFITDRLRQVAEEVSGRRPEHYCLWSSGVRLEAFARRGTVSTGSESSRYTFFYHGTVTEDRGVLDLARAMAETDREIRDKISLKLVGAGPDADRLRSVVEEVNSRGCSVEFLGFVPYESIPGMLGEADCCVCPLPDKPEWIVSSPLKVFEYAAAGKPIVLTPIAAHLDVFGAAKFIVWTGGATPRHFADALRQAYEQRRELAEQSASAPTYVQQNHSWEALGNKFSSYLLEQYAA